MPSRHISLTGPGALAAAIACMGLLIAGQAAAQVGSAFDADGHLVRMPFDPDVPVIRSEVRHTGDVTLFVSYCSLPIDDTIAHYQRLYNEQIELAPGWRLIGYGFDVGAGVYVFSLNYADQMYRFEVTPDSDGRGSVLTVLSQGRGLGYQPYLSTVAPFRPSDLDPVDYQGDLR